MPDALIPPSPFVPDLPPPGVQLTGASLTYAGLPLFDDLALTLPSGSWTALLGPSGCGKSSLIRTILGLTRGDVARARVLCTDGRPLAGRVSMMAQQDLLLPWLTVIENVLLGRSLRGERRDSAVVARAAALLAAVGLAQAGHLRPAALSGGMRQRAALARTLMENRPVVLMDEPFSAVDSITRIRLQTLAARVLSGCTVLLVTHDPLEALRLADRLVLMSSRPARLETMVVPPGSRPRAVDDPAILDAHRLLLRKLAEASE